MPIFPSTADSTQTNQCSPDNIRSSAFPKPKIFDFASQTPPRLLKPWEILLIPSNACKSSTLNSTERNYSTKKPKQKCGAISGKPSNFTNIAGIFSQHTETMCLCKHRTKHSAGYWKQIWMSMLFTFCNRMKCRRMQQKELARAFRQLRNLVSDRKRLFLRRY